MALFKFRTFSRGSKNHSHVSSNCVAIVRYRFHLCFFFTREDMDQGHVWSRHLIMVSKENDHDEF